MEVYIEDKHFDLTHPDKLIWDQGQISKADVLYYYQSVAPLMLPFLQGRRLTFRRYPHGATATGFYQRHLYEAPQWLQVREDGTPLVNNKADLAYLNQLGILEFHAPNHKAYDDAYLDWAVIDLDPMPPAGFAQTRQVAFMIKEILDHVHLAHYLKLSGATGLHIYIPLQPKTKRDMVIYRLKSMYQWLVHRFPEHVSMEPRIKNRQGIFLDVHQNSKAKSMIAPYSLRAGDRPTVSAPITWGELQSLLPEDLTLKVVLERIGFEDLWHSFFLNPQNLERLRGF